MAKQAGPYFITGCIDNLCFYEMEGQYYVRKKSSLDRKRVKKDPVFKGLMCYAGMLGKASKLASQVNREACRDKSSKSLFKPLKKEAYRMLREGIAEEDVLYLLRLGVGLTEEPAESLPDLPVEKEWDVERLLNDLMIGGFDDLKMGSLDYVIPP